MNNILYLLVVFVIIYVAFIIFWAMLCLVAYSLSVVTRKNVFINIVLGLNLLAMWILSAIIGIGLLWYSFSLLFQGQILWFLFWIFIGISLIFAIFKYLQVPFILITAFFSVKAEELNKSPDLGAKVILDKENNVIGIIENETGLNRRIAKLFLIAYGVNLVYLFLKSSDYPGFTVLDYIAVPALWVLVFSTIIGILIGFYTLLRYRKFFYPRKKILLARSLKWGAILTATFAVLNQVLL